MSETQDRGGAAHQDEDAEVAERERYRELLEELRTIIPGVQVLFAFLLTVPFSSRFADLDLLGRRAFTASLVAAALATVVFLTPAAYHRLTDRHRGRRLQVSVRMQLAGMTLLAAAIAVAVFVVTRFIFDTTVGGIIGAGVAVSALLLWWALPTVDDG